MLGTQISAYKMFPTNMSRLFYSFLAITGLITSSHAFQVSLPGPNRAAPFSSRARSSCFSSNTDVDQDTMLELTLEKPLGMILEEVEEGQPKGVMISELADGGSAAASGFKDQLVGLQVATVMGEDVTSFSFDDVMDKLINAPSPVSFEVITSSQSTTTEPLYSVGTVVAITVLEDDGSEKVVEAKVGDNLRAILLENNVEVYKGLKQKLGNCGGGGQCTFCAAEFVKTEGWEERSDYEDQKLKKNKDARLACLNNIQGPATIRLI